MIHYNKVCLALILFLSLFICFQKKEEIIYNVFFNIDKIDLLDLHNNARKNSLELNINLDEAAELHAIWMAKNTKMSHTGYRRSAPHERIQNKKFNYAGENIAMGYDTPQKVFNAWMNSKGHKANILNKNFKYVGFGIAPAEDGTIYWCTVLSD